MSKVTFSTSHCNPRVVTRVILQGFQTCIPGEMPGVDAVCVHPLNVESDWHWTKHPLEKLHNPLLNVLLRKIQPLILQHHLFLPQSMFRAVFKVEVVPARLV